MRALFSTRPGGPETLEICEAPEPLPGPGEVAIAVYASGVNFPDSLVIEDRYQLRPPRPFAPGSELAGVVQAIGEGVTRLRVGQRVLCSLPFGAMAETVVAPAIRCSVIPDSMPFDEAAAFLVTYGTVFHALKGRGNIAPGETLLVLGAAGGVGLAGIEVGKALGARVVAAASSAEKLALARSKGADATVLYPPGPLDKEGSRALAEAFKAACGADGADLVLDPVGGPYAEPALRVMAWEGRYLVVGFPAGIPSIPLNLALLKGCQIVGVFWGAYMARTPEAGAADAEALLALYAAGKLHPEVSERYPLEQGGAAIARLATREVRGKVVVQVR
jgi:NADPH2:quinone reductase